MASVSLVSEKSILNGGLDTTKSNCLSSSPLLFLWYGETKVSPCIILSSDETRLFNIKLSFSILWLFCDISCENIVHLSSPIWWAIAIKSVPVPADGS